MKKIAAFILLIIGVANGLLAQSPIPSYAEYLMEKGGIRIYYTLTLHRASDYGDSYKVVYYFHNFSKDKLKIEKVSMLRRLKTELVWESKTLIPGAVATYAPTVSIDMPVPKFSFTLVNITKNAKIAQAKQDEEDFEQFKEIQRIREEQQRQAALEAQSATVNFKIDVGATIIIDGQNIGECEPNVQYPVKIYKTGTNVQHKVEVVPLVSETAKEEQIMVLTAGAVVYKNFTFMNKIGDLETQRIMQKQQQEEQRIREEQLAKEKKDAEVKRQLMLLSNKQWIITNRKGNIVLGDTLSFDADKMLCTRIENQYYKFNHTFWLLQQGDLIKKDVWETKYAEMPTITYRQGVKNSFNQYEEKVLDFKIIQLTNDTLILKDYDREFIFKRSESAEERTKRIEADMLLRAPFVGKWNRVGYGSSEMGPFRPLSYPEQLEFFSDGKVKNRTSIKKSYIKSNTWESEYDYTWGINEEGKLYVKDYSGTHYFKTEGDYIIRIRYDFEKFERVK